MSSGVPFSMRATTLKHLPTMYKSLKELLMVARLSIVGIYEALIFSRRPTVPLPLNRQYHAFISYKRNTNEANPRPLDEPIARELQEGLHKLAKHWTHWRALFIFRDSTSMAAESNLWEAIQSRLKESEFLILLASPEAFEAPYG